jgi:hypothetical protein
MEHHDMGHTPSVLRETTYAAGQPVMAVDKIIADTVGSHIRLYGQKHLRQIFIERVFSDMTVIPDAEVDETHIFRQNLLTIKSFAPCTGIDIHAMSCSSQFQGNLTDIDAHAACVSCPKLAQRV